MKRKKIYHDTGINDLDFYLGLTIICAAMHAWAMCIVSVSCFAYLYFSHKREQ